MHFKREQWVSLSNIYIYIIHSFYIEKRNVKSSKKETPQLAQAAVVAPIEENKDAFEEDEEENQIKSKLENESMKEKEALPA